MVVTTDERDYVIRVTYGNPYPVPMTPLTAYDQPMTKWAK